MTVARAVEKMLPDHRLIYFGDLARTPYGSKSPETILSYARQNTEFLLARGAKLIVIACNSAASVASEDLPARFSVPFFEVITPAVARAVATTRSGRIGVIGTRATVASGVYEKMIKTASPECEVFSEACPLLVPLVEEGWMGKQETKMILRRYLEPLKQRCIDTLVLGCTHYPLLLDLIRPRVGRRVNVIDSADVLAADLKSYLKEHPEIDCRLERDGENMFYVSDITEAAISTARSIFGRDIRLDRVAWE